MMEITSNDMVALPIETFVKGLPLRVDTFLALNSEKYVLLFKAGIPVDLERVQGYQDRNLSHLHVHKTDCKLFFESQLSMAQGALKHPKLPMEHKVHFLNLAHELLFARMDAMGFSHESYEVAKLVARSVLTTTPNEPDLHRLLKSLAQTSEAALNHSLVVATLSAALGRALGWQRPETLEKLALGGVLHDIGLMFVPKELHHKPRAHMTPAERTEYESHVDKGVRLLQTLPSVTSDVISITAEHHENANGEGYPHRLRDLKINPLAKVVSLADVFSELIMPMEQGLKGLTPQEALERIEFAMGLPFNKQNFKALKTLVG